jgi:hypothetical protein
MCVSRSSIETDRGQHEASQKHALETFAVHRHLSYLFA